ncbi:MAG: hypothetical protein HQK50_00330 [Oligoflexia bacterium]|nr:hypothetical protein [Oligoflexia bacterium]
MKGLLMTVITVAFLLISTQLIQASETDQYYAWDKELLDSGKQINDHLNNHIQEVLLQEESSVCEKVVKKIMSRVAMWPLKQGDHWLKYNPEIDQVPIYHSDRSNYYQESIYKGIWRFNLGGSVKSYLSPTIEVNGIRMGGDKLSHFLGGGAMYYLAYVRNYAKLVADPEMSAEQAHVKAMEKSIKLGVLSERTVLGYSRLISGVFSYADLEANFQGFTLFYSFCHGDRPRLKYLPSEKRWQLERLVDFKEYVNPYFDESFNPNAYRNMMWKRVGENLQKYCLQKDLPFVQQRFDHYRQILNTTSPSYSQTLLDEMREEQSVPDSLPYTLSAICQ